jgi:hypothetical protein
MDIVKEFLMSEIGDEVDEKIVSPLITTVGTIGVLGLVAGAAIYGMAKKKQFDASEKESKRQKLIDKKVDRAIEAQEINEATAAETANLNAASANQQPKFY